MFKKLLSLSLVALMMFLPLVTSSASEPLKVFSDEVASFSFDLPDVRELRSEFNNEISDSDYSDTKGSTPDAAYSPVKSNGGYDFIDYNYNWNSGSQITWDYRNKTLTLNNANVYASATKGHTYGIVVPDGTTIVLKGNNSVVCAGAYGGEFDSGGIVADGNLTITGSGSLVARGNDSTGYAAGINADNLYFTNCSDVKSYAGNSPIFSYGIIAETITITNSNVTAESGASVSGVSIGILSDKITVYDDSTVNSKAGISPHSVGIATLILHSEDSEVITKGSDITEECYFYKDYYLSAGIVAEDYIAAKYGRIVGLGGNVFKNKENTYSFGIACTNVELLYAIMTAVAGDAFFASIGLCVENRAQFLVCDCAGRSGEAKYTYGFYCYSASINSYYFEATANNGTERSMGAYAIDHIAVNGGQAIFNSTGEQDSCGVFANYLYVNAGNVTATASESSDESYGVIANLTLVCGDMTLSGDDGGFAGVYNLNSSRIKVRGREDIESGELQDTVVVNDGEIDHILLADGSGKDARYLEFAFDFQGQGLYAYMVDDNPLSYKQESRVIVHAKSPMVIYCVQSSDENIIKVNNEMLGTITAVNDGTVEIKATAYDLLAEEMVKDESGNEASYIIEVKCKMTFWEKIVRFFRSLFGLD